MSNAIKLCIISNIIKLGKLSISTEMLQIPGLAVVSRDDDEDAPMSTFEEELALLDSEESELASADSLQPVSFKIISVLYFFLSNFCAPNLARCKVCHFPVTHVAWQPLFDNS